MNPTRLVWTQVPASALHAEPALQTNWNALNAKGLNSPFLDATIVSTALKCFGSGDERLVIGTCDGAPEAMFVLRRSGTGRWETFQPSQLPLGSWLVAPGLSLEEAASSLLRKALFPSLAVSFTQADPLCTPRPLEAACTRIADYIETAWVDVHGSFEDFWSQRGKNLRGNMRKQRNKLAAEGIQGRLVVLDSPTEMALAVARYGQLESAGWKAEKGTAIHPDNAQGRFYSEMLEQAAGRGEGVVYEYRFGERLVAMHLCLRRANQLVILKTTYDETVDKSLSPSLLLHQDEMQMVFAEGHVHRVEYYGRIMDWHTRWTDNRRTLFHLTCYRWQWVKRLAARSHVGAVRHPDQRPEPIPVALARADATE